VGLDNQKPKAATQKEKKSVKKRKMEKMKEGEKEEGVGD
jgi:hypothetical protein